MFFSHKEWPGKKHINNCLAPAQSQDNPQICLCLCIFSFPESWCKDPWIARGQSRPGLMGESRRYIQNQGLQAKLQFKAAHVEDLFYQCSSNPKGLRRLLLACLHLQSLAMTKNNFCANFGRWHFFLKKCRWEMFKWRERGFKCLGHVSDRFSDRVSCFSNPFSHRINFFASNLIVLGGNFVLQPCRPNVWGHKASRNDNLSTTVLHT